MTLITATVAKANGATLQTPKRESLDTKNMRLAFAQTINVKISIIAVNSGAKTFTVAGNKTGVFVNAFSFTIINSTGNNGTYTVNGNATFNGTNTVITVNEVVPSSTADGIISANVTGTKIYYYNVYKAVLDEYIVFETLTSIALNDVSLQSYNIVSVDNIPLGKTGLIHINSVLQTIPVSSTQTRLIYDKGFQNHQMTTSVVITGTIEAADTSAGTNLKYAIIVADPTNKVFAINGDKTNVFTNGVSFTVAGSAANNGTYTVTGASVFSGVNTYITVTQVIPSSTADGYITQP